VGAWVLAKKVHLPALRAAGHRTVALWHPAHRSLKPPAAAPSYPDSVISSPAPPIPASRAVVIATPRRRALSWPAPLEGGQSTLPLLLLEKPVCLEPSRFLGNCNGWPSAPDCSVAVDFEIFGPFPLFPAARSPAQEPGPKQISKKQKKQKNAIPWLVNHGWLMGQAAPDCLQTLELVFTTQAKSGWRAGGPRHPRLRTSCSGWWVPCTALSAFARHGDSRAPPADGQRPARPGGCTDRQRPSARPGAGRGSAANDPAQLALSSSDAPEAGAGWLELPWQRGAWCGRDNRFGLVHGFQYVAGPVAAARLQLLASGFQTSPSAQTWVDWTGLRRLARLHQAWTTGAGGDGPICCRAWPEGYRSHAVVIAALLACMKTVRTGQGTSPLS